MKRQTNNRILLAWLFAVIFSVPSLTRTIHIYQSGCEGEVCSHSASHKHPKKHDCNTCILCKFALSTFTEVAILSSETIQPVFYQPEYITYQEKGYATVISSNYLRGPPVA